MNRLLLTLAFVLVSLSAFSQNLVHKWVAYRGDDGSIVNIYLYDDNSGVAHLKLSERHEALPYDDGSMFWDTYSISGGYYFIVTGEKVCPLVWTSNDEEITMKLNGVPEDTVTVTVDEEYSFWDLSDLIEFKHEILARWRWDLTRNEDVKWQKSIMTRTLQDTYGDLFTQLVAEPHSLLPDSD